MPKRGAFVVLEGIDNSGKSTTMKAVKGMLEAEGEFVVAYHFPTEHSAVGVLIGKFLVNELDLTPQAAFLIMSADRWEMNPIIDAYLDAGNTVLCDRHAPSGAAYGIATNTKGMTAAWCQTADSGLLVPDAVIYFDLPAEVACRRADFGKQRTEKVEYQKRVADAFNYLYSEEDGWHNVDATMPPEQLIEAVAAECRRVIAAVKDSQA